MEHTLRDADLVLQVTHFSCDVNIQDLSCAQTSQNGAALVPISCCGGV